MNSTFLPGISQVSERQTALEVEEAMGNGTSAESGASLDNVTLFAFLNMTMSVAGSNFQAALDNETWSMNRSVSTEAYKPPGSSMMAEASRSILYKIGVALHIYYLPIVALIGLPGNLLSLRIMLGPSNRRISCCVYMAALALGDTCSLSVASHYWMVTGGPAPFITRGVGYWECKWVVYFFHTCQSNAVLQIVFMTVDRFIAIRFPLKATYLCNPRRARIMACCAAVYGLCFNVPYFFNSAPTAKYVCAAFAENNTTFMIVYSWLNTCMNSFIPFVLLLSLNLVIIVTIKKRGKEFRKFEMKNISKKTSSADQSAGSEKKTDKKNEKKSDKPTAKGSSDNQLTVMLLSVSFIFLVLSLPQYIRYTVYSFVDLRASSQTFATYILAAHGSNKLYITASAVNFYLYCLSGSKFRQDVKNVIFCCRRKGLTTGSQAKASTSSLNTVA